MLLSRALTWPLVALGIGLTSLATAQPPGLDRAPDEVLTGAELLTYAAAGYEMEPALAQRAGVTFLSSGDSASEDWILIRGLPRDSSRNVLVLLDGVPVGNAYTQALELHDVPPSMVDRLEVWKAPLPARYGAYHAVLNLVSRPAGTQEPQARVEGAVGSLDTVRAEVGGSGRLANLGWDLSVTGLTTTGLSKTRRTPPLQTLTYGDRSYRDVAPVLRLTGKLGPQTRVSAFGLGSAGKKAFSDDEYRTRDFALAGVQIQHGQADGPSLTGSAWAGWEHYFLRLYMHPDIAAQDRTRAGVRLDGAWPLGPVVLRGGGLVDRSGLQDAAGDRAQLVGAGYAEVAYQPWELLSLDAGVRLDAGHGADPAWSPSASLRLQPREGTVVLAKAASTVRWPVLGELAAGLRPERLDSTALRLQQSLTPVLELAVEGALLRLEDELAPGPTGTYANLAEATDVRTVEATLRYKPTANWWALLTYTWTQAEQAGAPIAYGPPEHLAGATALHTTERGMARLSARYLGKKAGIQRHGGEFAELADALLLDAYLARRVTPELQAFVLVENLTDRTYETFQGRPMLPRTVLVGLELAAR